MAGILAAKDVVMEPRGKSSQGGIKGRRVLQYGNASLLKGKKIYLDLHGYKRASFIESGLRERGAAIEGFFTKDTRYLVTCRNLSDQDKYSSSPRTPSSSVLSNVNTNKRRSSHPAQSPFSTNSPDTPKPTPTNASRVSRDQHLPQHSRSRNIVAAAKMRSTGSTDVLQLAKNWNIKIIHVEDIVKYFSKYPVGTEVSLSSDQHKSLSPGVRKLRSPFLKCEDTSRLYKPLFLEVKKWPQLNLDCGPGECPFDTPQKQRRDSGDAKVRAEKSDKKRSGYCECCGVRFDDFILHVKGDQHMTYATDPDNFASLDAFYDMYNIPTLDQFVDAHAISSPEHSMLPEVESSPVDCSLLYHNDTEIATSIVDIETVEEKDDQQLALLRNNIDVHEQSPGLVTTETKSTSIVDIETVEKEDNQQVVLQERQSPSGLVMTEKKSSPKRSTLNSDLTPDAKRCRKSQSGCSPREDNHAHMNFKTPPRSSPLKNFSIVLTDSLKSPMKSPTFGNTPSPVKSPITNVGYQSPRHCVVLLHDIAKSPTSVTTSPRTPTDSRNKRTVRSVSVSPEGIIRRDTLMESPVKEEIPCTSANIYKIINMSPKHLCHPRDILQVSPQTTPQKELQ